jgi:dTMP kinase
MVIETKKRGYFIVFEGIDGAGKTTALKYLVEQLKAKDFHVYQTREPGGTCIAEKIRELILSKYKEEEMCSMTEMLLFAAARAQHIETVIKPKLDQGMVVVCDRFADSTFAYQGFGRGHVPDVLALENLVHNGFYPDCTLFFEISLDESIRRLSLRPEAANRLDDENIKFKARVYQGFLKRFEQFKERMYKIDAMQDIQNVQLQIDDWINKVLVQRRKQNAKPYRS